MADARAAPRPAPEHYVHGHHEAVLRSHRWRTAANSAAYLLDRLTPGTSVLDVGCGPGTLSADLAARVAPAPVTAVDSDADVLVAAREHVRARGLTNVAFVHGDVRTIDLEAHDVVHAHQVLQHLADPVGALARLAELARPGGLVAVRDADYAAFAWSPADDRLERWRALYLEVARAGGGTPDAGRYLLGWAHTAGLDDAVYTTSTWTFATPPERAWWADLWAERITASELGRRLVATGLTRAEELEEIAEGWRAWARAAGASFMVPHGELLVHVDA